MRQLQENVAKDTNPCAWLSLTSSKDLTYPLGIPLLILLPGEIHIMRLFHDDLVSMETAQSLSLSDVRNALFHPPFLPSSLHNHAYHKDELLLGIKIVYSMDGTLKSAPQVSARHPYPVSLSSSMPATIVSLQKMRNTSRKSLLLSISHTQSWD